MTAASPDGALALPNTLPWRSPLTWPPRPLSWTLLALSSLCPLCGPWPRSVTPGRWTWVCVAGRCRLPHGWLLGSVWTVADTQHRAPSL